MYPSKWCIFHGAKLMMIYVPISTTEHSHGVVLELLLKLLYPKGPLRAIFIKEYEVSDIGISNFSSVQNNFHNPL